VLFGDEISSLPWDLKPLYHEGIDIYIMKEQITLYHEGFHHLEMHCQAMA
jgi:hypothetical protein